MPVALSTEPNASRPGTWALRFGLLCIVVATLPFAWQGIAHWRDDDQVRGVVIGFFQRLAEGRRSAALRYLSPELQRQFSESPGQADTVTAGVSIQVLDIHRHGDEAIVNASIGKQGYSLRPMIRLHRNQSTWTIVAIDGVEVDPRWIKMQARIEGEELADELAEKLHADE